MKRTKHTVQQGAIESGTVDGDAESHQQTADLLGAGKEGHSSHGSASPQPLGKPQPYSHHDQTHPSFQREGHGAFPQGQITTPPAQQASQTRLFNQTGSPSSQMGARFDRAVQGYSDQVDDQLSRLTLNEGFILEPGRFDEAGAWLQQPRVIDEAGCEHDRDADGQRVITVHDDWIFKP